MNNLYKSILLSLLCLMMVSVTFLTGCTAAGKPDEPLSRTQFVLGTTATITLYSGQSEKTLDEAFEQLTKLEDLLSINKSGTLIDKINENAGIKPVVVDPDTFHLLQTALMYSKLTHGAFDITIGPIVKLWHIGFSDAKVPSQKEIEALLPLIDYQMVQFNEEDHTVYLEKPGMMIDLGGIGKGYAADQIAALLKEKGVQHATINLGGNVYTIGNKPGNKLWAIGVQDPFNPRGKTIGSVEVANKSVVTSGIYERYIEDTNGKKYHHILNPETGYPYNNGIASVTIISDTSTDGDALSTATFALGIEEGLSFLETQKGVDAIFVTTDCKVYMTSGLKGVFTLTDDRFTLVEEAF